MSGPSNSNQNPTKTVTNNRGRGSWRPYNRQSYNRYQPRTKPISISIPNSGNSNTSTTSSTTSSISIAPIIRQPLVSIILSDGKSGEFSGWKLYHPTEG